MTTAEKLVESERSHSKDLFTGQIKKLLKKDFTLTMEGRSERVLNVSTTDHNSIGNESVCKAAESYTDDDDSEIADTQWSLADLPDVILVRIMKFLCLKEKYYLSITCRRLNEIFTHPDLWKLAHINLLHQGRENNLSRWAYSSVLPKTISEIVKRFSHLFQHLHLQTPSIIKPFEKAVILMLQDLANECRLESLSLSIGVLESKDEDIQFTRNYYSDTRDVHYVTALLRNAVRLKHLNVISWPLRHDTEENGLFQTILSNAKLKSLESMRLFYIDKKAQWTGRVPNLPTNEEICDIFTFLPNLTHISLRSPMINNDVIKLLASEKRRSLKTFEVLIMWSRATSAHDGCAIPDISDQLWRKLKTTSPNVQVEFVIHIRIPFEELIVMFKPEVPLSSLVILKYGQCGASLVDSIASKYGRTLTSFVSLCDSDGCDVSLLNLAKECTKLDSLVYHGDVNYKTIMQMSDLIRDTQRDVKVFEFKEKNVKTDNLHEADEDDIVIRQDNETLEYVIAPIRSWHIDQELHVRKLDLMLDHVKANFGTTWSLYSE